VHVRPQHLTNAALALSGTEPLSEAWRTVAGFRGLMMTGWSTSRRDPKAAGEVWQTVRPPPFGGRVAPETILPHEELGLGIDRLIELLAGPDAGSARAFFAERRMKITLIWGDPPSAAVRMDRRNGDGFVTNTYSTGREPRPQSRPAAIRNEGRTIPFALVLVLATLWSDTLVHEATVPKTKKPAAVAPAAGFLPGRLATSPQTADVPQQFARTSPGVQSSPESPADRSFLNQGGSADADQRRKPRASRCAA
jgi:hypothetical protein